MSGIVNPYYGYAVSFSLALVGYSLRWSDLYPKLSFTLLLFLFTTIVIHLISGRKVSKKNSITFRVVNTDQLPPLILTFLIYLLWGCEFVYAGGVPLLKILLKQPFDYKTFGIPSLHVFIVTFSSFYTVYLLHLYFSEKSRRILFLYVINLVAALLIYNRGMLFFNLSSSLMIYLIYKNTISVKKIALGGALMVCLLFFFGMLGSLRGTRLAGEPYSNKDFLVTGGANESFRKSVIPSEFFWSYIYVTSPIANLQTNIDTYPVRSFSARTIAEMINNEIVMDFISKRVNRLVNIEREKENTIPGPFNVSTVYSRSFSYAGWPGMIIMALIILLIPLVYIKILPVTSPFFLAGFAILCTMFLFLPFDNTIRFTGLSFQLVYPVLLHYSYQKIGWIKNFFVHNKVTSIKL